MFPKSDKSQMIIFFKVLFLLEKNDSIIILLSVHSQFYSGGVVYMLG